MKRRGLAWRVISGNAFIVDSKKSFLYELTDVGTFIWKMLDKTDSKENLIQGICEEYEVPYDQASQDLDQFLSKLSKNNLIDIG